MGLDIFHGDSEDITDNFLCDNAEISIKMKMNFIKNKDYYFIIYDTQEIKILMAFLCWHINAL